MEIKEYITHQQIEKVIEDAVAINLLSEMIHACNIFLDSWETFDNIFVDFNRKQQHIILSSSGKKKCDEINTKEYMRIILHNADVVKGYRKIMQQKTDELIKRFRIECKVEFPTEFDKDSFKLPI